jgi:hypothetical protein
LLSLMQVDQVVRGGEQRRVARLARRAPLRSDVPQRLDYGA